MISFEEAYRLVVSTAKDFGNETVILANAHGRVLAEDIEADRDFPPFDRATKDGIAINFSGITQQKQTFTVAGIAAAGAPQQLLSDNASCIEIMTGAIVPQNADTVIMYEHLDLKEGMATLKSEVKKGQNIHKKGTDEAKGTIVLNKNSRISAAEIGVLASVGRFEVLVKKNPKVAVISTGDELIDVHETPKEHQIRKSNTHTLHAALLVQGIHSKLLHINDIEKELQSSLSEYIKTYDVLLLSGGVSMGKYDFLPLVFEQLGIEKHFHKVAQRPGKPFWFGFHPHEHCTVFAFPGNPASTFANYHVYFLPWLQKCMNLPVKKHTVVLGEAFENTLPLTRFIRARVDLKDGQLMATLVLGNGSGDLTSLVKSNGFIRIAPNTNVSPGTVVAFYPTKNSVE